MKEIALSGRYSHLVTLVDDEDVDAVMQHRWFRFVLGNTTYARRRWIDDDGRDRGQLLHPFLTGWPLTDHINRDGLDNTRANLRPASKSQNGWNAQAMKARNGRSCESIYKGVSRNGVSWKASICVNYKSTYLGTFRSELEAALAYDNAARQQHGEFANVNFPQGVAGADRG